MRCSAWTTSAAHSKHSPTCYPNKTIAGVLEISIWTVSTHLRRVFAKFGVNTRAALVAKMIRNRMTELRER
jgi:DNA-binding CsgD family transcriptional regulator